MGSAPLTSAAMDPAGFACPLGDCITLDSAILNCGPERFTAHVRLLLTAWASRPAGSLPNADQVLQALSGLTPLQWRACREQVLQGFECCTDGRLYHLALCREVVRSWALKTTAVGATARDLAAERQARARARRLVCRAALAAHGVVTGSRVPLQELRTLLAHHGIAEPQLSEGHDNDDNQEPASRDAGVTRHVTQRDAGVTQRDAGRDAGVTQRDAGGSTTPRVPSLDSPGEILTATSPSFHDKMNTALEEEEEEVENINTDSVTARATPEPENQVEPTHWQPASWEALVAAQLGACDRRVTVTAVREWTRRLQTIGRVGEVEDLLEDELAVALPWILRHALKEGSPALHARQCERAIGEWAVRRPETFRPPDRPLRFPLTKMTPSAGSSPNGPPAPSTEGKA